MVRLVLALVILGGCDVIASKNTSKEELLETIHTFNRAFETSDIVTLQSMITDDYQHTNGSSKAIGKVDWLNYLRKRKKEIDEGVLIVNSYQMDETKITIYGNTAIVTARISVVNTRNNQETQTQYRVTHLWIKQDGEWKRAGFHDGRIQTETQPSSS